MHPHTHFSPLLSLRFLFLLLLFVLSPPSSYSLHLAHFLFSRSRCSTSIAPTSFIQLIDTPTFRSARTPRQLNETTHLSERVYSCMLYRALFVMGKSLAWVRCHRIMSCNNLHACATRGAWLVGGTIRRGEDVLRNPIQGHRGFMRGDCSLSRSLPSRYDFETKKTP